MTGSSWHLFLQWAGGLSAAAVVGVTLTALRREHGKKPDNGGDGGDDNIFMAVAILAVSILTLSTLLNFLFFVIL